MGLFKLLFGSNQRTPNRKNNLSKNHPKNYSELKQKTQELKAQNKKWETDSKKMISLRNRGSELEKKKQLKEAIDVYLESIKFGEEETNKLHLYNYAHDIDRVIILYSKTKQFELLEEFLKRNIEKYPEYNKIEKWQERLTKLEKKK
ncbi:hypothetical protein C7S20_12575 [Christiangramia fulva]|uniref:Tetratricopeptide repeat protein n=1 Tax=Christiangramia fulva TaxID=2126553 RepID=A0A2R3Z6X9_9FLAO|nr:hypothetical protein [Christiangramia fulva]AVR46020.1 hypothetical protein C7S20_12575 [Christiangramia fulva]